MAGTPKIDRRVARTRDMLHQALMSLILDMGYEKVTVADICDAANVGRSTFYAHFTCKDDLRRHGLDHLRKWILNQHREAVAAHDRLEDRAFAFSLILFEHARDHLDLFRALVGGGGASAQLDIIRETLSDLVRDELAAVADQDSADAIPREIMVQYVVGAFMALLTWWLDGGAKLPPAEIDGMFRRLASEGIPKPAL